jgi:2-polyprenyl-6-methoxyphenol hydroxylase-like FAD-dependent oxidoreductase
MMLAAELALAEVDVAVVERRPDHALAGSRAGGFHPRTIEVLDQRGVAGRFLAEGQTVEVARFGATALDMGGLPTRHPYTLGLWQREIERIMAGWIAELGVRVGHGRELTGLAQDEDGVDVGLAGGGTLRARYLVGCDGGRSLVRKAAGIAFPGWEATRSHLIAEVEMTEAPELGIRRDARGTHALGRRDYEIRDGAVVYADEGPVGVMITEAQVEDGEPDMRDLSAALVAIYGTDFGAHSPTALSRFTDATRQAAAYRAGRVLLAGDAAHVHSPVGGQGIGLGVQDAVNLGWKLAQVVKGISGAELLDTYHAERHPAGARTLRYTMALGALQEPDDRVAALDGVLAEVLGMDGPRGRLAGLHSGLDVRYDLGEGHPLLGRRVPDLDLVTAAGPQRLFELLHGARPVLLDLGEPGVLDLGAWAGRVDRCEARVEGGWELPVAGPVAAPSAVLVRPDGHAAWVGDGTAAGLADALARWFGAPAA